MKTTPLPPAARRLLAGLQAGPGNRLELLADGRWHLRVPDATTYRRVQRPAVDALLTAGLVVDAPCRPFIRRTLRVATP